MPLLLHLLVSRSIFGDQGLSLVILDEKLASVSHRRSMIWKICWIHNVRGSLEISQLLVIQIAFCEDQKRNLGTLPRSMGNCWRGSLVRATVCSHRSGFLRFERHRLSQAFARGLQKTTSLSRGCLFLLATSSSYLH